MNLTKTTRYYETTYDDYLSAYQRYNIHPELNDFRSKCPAKLTDLPNLVVHGPAGTGRYTQVLTILQKYSPSNLRYDSKIYMSCDNKPESKSSALVTSGSLNPKAYTNNKADADVDVDVDVDAADMDVDEVDVEINYEATATIAIAPPSHTCRKTQKHKPDTSVKRKTIETGKKCKTSSSSNKKKAVDKSGGNSSGGNSSGSNSSGSNSSGGNNSGSSGGNSGSSGGKSMNVSSETKMAKTSENAYRISDIHYEVDIPSLGCNAKILWHDIYNHIVDIVSSSPNREGIIVCKNFHQIHNELLSVFYSYMHHPVQYQHNICIRFILVTEHVCFMPSNIINSCLLIPVRRPSLAIYKTMAKTNCSYYAKYEGNNHNATPHSEPININILDQLDLTSIVNLKEVFSIVNLHSDENIPDDMFSKVVSPIHELIHNQSSRIDIYSLRNRLYNLLIFGIDVHESIWYILNQLAPELSWQVSQQIFSHFYEFMKQYNNNYRSIYHLERIFLTIRQCIQLRKNDN